MRVVIIKDDNKVIIDGVAHAVDCSDMPADFHAFQWDGVRGEVEYRMVSCVHCHGRNKKPNLMTSDLAPYQPHIDRWNAEKAKADAARQEHQVSGDSV